MGRPKYISGIAVFTQDLLGITIDYLRDFGYDQVVDVVDVSNDGVPFSSKIYTTERIRLLYEKVQKKLSTKKLKIFFRSGDSATIEVFVPTYRQKVQAYGGQLETKISGHDMSFRQDAQTGPLKSSDPVAYAMLPIKDPKKAFQYPNSWSYSSQGSVFIFDSKQLQALSKGGFGTPKQIPETQFAQFAAVLGKGNVYTKAEEVWDAALTEDVQVIFSFVWSKDIIPIPEDAITIEVCNDPSSPSFYRVTKLDSEGNTIPEHYLNGTVPCRFMSGACQVETLNFKTRLIVKEPVQNNDGTIQAIVTSNDADPSPDSWVNTDAFLQDKYPTYGDVSSSDFIFVLKGKNGRYETSGTVSQNTWTFEDIEASITPYVIQITDVDTG